MWSVLHFLDVEAGVSPVASPVSQWRVFSWIMGVVLCCLRVTSLYEGSPDVANMAAHTGKLFCMSFRSHPVYGSPDVSLQLAAMSESADDQFPAWLWFNSSSRSLSGVPLPGDEGVLRLTITATCKPTPGHTHMDTAHCSDHTPEVFELTVSRCPWANSQAWSVSAGSHVVEVETESASLGCGVSQVMSAYAGCEGVPVIASLVLCSTSEQLTSRKRLDLMFHLSEFLTIPVSAITLEPSSTRLLAAIERGFQMVSAGPGLDDACHLSQHIEIVWWLPCAAVKHLNDFIKVLQHNVDGGRLQREIGTIIVGWYIASSNSLVTRQSRRRRAAGYHTVAPTPILNPLKPTSVAAGRVDSEVTSSVDLSSRTGPVDASSRTVPAHVSFRTVSTYLSSQAVPSTIDYYVIFPESWKPVEASISHSTVMSDHATLVAANFAETTQLSSVSQSPSSAHTTSPSPATISPSPAHTTSPSPAHKTSPSSALKTSPSPADKTSPSSAHKTSPSSAHKTSPSSADKTSPSSAHKTSPSSAHKTSPSSADKTSPSSADKTSPSPAHKTSPSSAHKTSPSSADKTSPSPADKTSSSSATIIKSSQLLTQAARTPQFIEQHQISTAQLETDATFSYLSTQQHIDRYSIPSPSSPDLTASYVRQTPALSPTVTTQYHPVHNVPRSTFWQPVRQSSVRQSSVRQSSVDTASDLSPWQSAPTGAPEHATFVEDSRVSSSLLFPSSTSIDWFQESETETSTSSSEHVFLFHDIQTVSPPEQMPVLESTATPEVWFLQSQMSDSLTLWASLASSSPASAYLVLSRNVEVIGPLFTSTGSVLEADLWTDALPPAPGSTSVISDTVTYFAGSDWRGKYNSTSDIDPVWDAVIHAYSNIQILPTQQLVEKHSQELEDTHLWRWFSLAQLTRLSHSAQIETHSQDIDMLDPLYTSHRSVAASGIVADWGLMGKSSESTEEAGRLHPTLAVVTSIIPPVDSSKRLITTSISSLASSPSADPSMHNHTEADPSIHDHTQDQSTVTIEVDGRRVARPRSDTTDVTANTTSATTPVSSPFLLFTSAATKRHRPRTTTLTVTRAKTTTTAATTTKISTTQRSSTIKRPAVRKPSTPRVSPTTHRTTTGWTPRVSPTTHRTTTGWTPRVSPTTHRTATGWTDLDYVYPGYFNNRPYVQRPIKVIRADQGKLLELMVPHDVFYDIEDGDTRHLSLSLELPSNQALPDNFWLYIETSQQVIKALALHEDMDVKNMSVALVARDKQGLAGTDYITLQINDTPRRSFTHVFRMKFAIAFLQFMHSRRNMTELVERIASYFRDDGAQLVTVLEVRQGSFMMSWTNNSLSGATCPSDEIRQLYARMVRKDGTVKQTFSRHIGRHLHLKEVQLQPWGSCLAPGTTTMASTSTKYMSTQLVAEVKAGHGFSVWAHVILPVLIAVLVFILIILIIIFCNRRRRHQQATLNTEKEVISNDGNPIIFPTECVPEDLLSKPREPQVLLAPAEAQPHPNISAGSSLVKNNLNRDQERARKSRDNREQEWLNKDTQIHDPECERDWSRNFHRKHAKDSSSGRRHRDADRTSRVSASSTLSWDRPNNHYLEEEAGSRSSTLKSTKSAGSDKRHRKSPPPYWQHNTDPPPYRMPPPYLSNNSAQM